MKRFPAISFSAAPAEYPLAQRPPRHCQIFAVGHEPARLVWDLSEISGRKLYLRVCVASDIREIVRIGVFFSGGPLIGEFDLRFSYVFQIHEILLDLPRREISGALEIELRLIEGSRPQWLIWRGPGDGHSPHLLEWRDSSPGLGAAVERASSPESLQPFGWLEGCVLDGLLAWADHPAFGRKASAAIGEHLRYHASPQGELRCENPRNIPCDGAVYGLEGVLPFAVLAQIEPDHPWLSLAARFLGQRMRAPSEWRVAETSYTCGYTMAALGLFRRDEDWRALSAAHLLGQKTALSAEGKLWLRRSMDGARKEFPDWSRGIAWYLLGLAKSVPLLGGHRELEREFRRAADWIIALQREDGLWGVFANEPDLPADTSACAGISAALAIGARVGLLDKAAAEAATLAHDRLRAFLTPDGFLGGVAQSNKGGLSLQRSSLRVMAQFGLGLYLLLAREVSRENPV